jgi:cell filamentation protein
MSDDPYVYPGTKVLRNKLGIRDAEQLEAFERRMAAQRAAEGIPVPVGDFDLAHLAAIHGHLF